MEFEPKHAAARHDYHLRQPESSSSRHIIRTSTAEDAGALWKKTDRYRPLSVSRLPTRVKEYDTAVNGRPRNSRTKTDPHGSTSLL